HKTRSRPQYFYAIAGTKELQRVEHDGRVWSRGGGDELCRQGHRVHLTAVDGRLDGRDQVEAGGDVAKAGVVGGHARPVVVVTDQLRIAAAERGPELRRRRHDVQLCLPLQVIDEVFQPTPAAVIH